MKRILIIVFVFLTIAALLSVGIYQNTERRYDYGEIPGGVSMRYREQTDSYQMTYYASPKKGGTIPTTVTSSKDLLKEAE
jgi:hypothetical protein